VIGDLEAAGLITVIASLHPLVTFKTSEGVEKELKRNRKDWQQERSQAREMKGRRR
jgi:release factor H-coupled RctB family protein